MKTLSMLVLAMLLSGFPGFGADNPPVPQGTTPGRFVLLTSTVRYGTGVQDPVVMRLDTATGQVWTYEMAPLFGLDGKPSGYVAVWKSTNEEGGKMDSVASQSVTHLATPQPSTQSK